MTDQLHLGAIVDGSGTRTYPDTHSGNLTAHGQFISANFAACTGSGNYVGSLAVTATAYVQWMEYALYIPTTNSGAVTINLDGIGVINLKLLGASLVGGELPSGCYIKVIFTGSNFELIGASTGSGTSTVPPAWPQQGAPGIDADPAPAISWPSGPAAPNSFIIPLFSGSASTRFDSTNKRVVGQIKFDPTLSKWRLSATSTATLYMVLQTTNGAIYAAGDLYRETGSGAPTTVAATTTTVSTTAALVSVDVSAAFVVSANAGIFDARIWIQTANGTDYATCTEAWIEVTP